ncbi:MAG: hypothetical protein WB239_00265 [Acidimicrobiia bacterium]
MMGSRIGHHSVVGANALITQFSTIPPWSLVLGVPARVIADGAHQLLDPNHSVGLNVSGEQGT